MLQSRWTLLPVSKLENRESPLEPVGPAGGFCAVGASANRKEKPAKIKAAGTLAGFLYFAGANTRSTNEKGFASASDCSADAAQIRFPAPSRDVMRVAYVVAIDGSLTADFTRASHENTSPKP
jgi:hypothetical protein